MHRSILAVAVIAFMLMAAPVVAQNTPQPAISTEFRDVLLPPPLDRVLRDYERAWRAGDAAALASLFADDGFVLQSNRLPIRGRPAIRAAYASQGGGSLRLRAFAFHAGDTSGYIIGAYGYGNSTNDTGKFTLTLCRDGPDGPWLIFSDMDNSNTAPKQQSAPPVSSPVPSEA